MRFNYTGRIKINREHVSVALNDERQGKIAPAVDIDLSEYDLPDNAPVFLEFYSSSFLRRDQYGTCAEPKRKGPTAFPSSNRASELKVRLKVLDPQPDSHKILALMKGAKPEDEPQAGSVSRDSLLALRAADLRGQVWRVLPSTSRDEHPELLIDKRFGDHQLLAATDWFQAIVMPSAFEQVLTSIVVHHKFDNIEEDSIWAAWLRYALLYSSAKAVPEIDDSDDSTLQEAVEWIAEVVETWANANEYSTAFNSFYRGIGDG